ncbi:hypothetical protein ACFXKS_09660 [Streptomyces scopuliridis]|uniref:hypothetical protein n=1 Tax=Streptomyces scopuliridis TaxID=452529 RepID=UPI00367DF9EA
MPKRGEDSFDEGAGATVAAVVGAVIVGVRRGALSHEAEEQRPAHATEDSVTVFAD